MTKINFKNGGSVAVRAVSISERFIVSVADKDTKTPLMTSASAQPSSSLSTPPSKSSSAPESTPLALSAQQTTSDPTREHCRDIETEHLNVAQQAIWQDVKSGDLDAINVFLKIHDRRVKLWGLDKLSNNSDQAWTINVVYGDDG